MSYPPPTLQNKNFLGGLKPTFLCKMTKNVPHFEELFTYELNFRKDQLLKDKLISTKKVLTIEIYIYCIYKDRDKLIQGYYV